MKHYFRVTKTVGELTRVLCAVLEDQHKKTRLRFRLPSLSRALFRRMPAGLKIDGDRLTVDGADAAGQRTRCCCFACFTRRSGRASTSIRRRCAWSSRTCAWSTRKLRSAPGSEPAVRRDADARDECRAGAEAAERRRRVRPVHSRTSAASSRRCSTTCTTSIPWTSTRSGPSASSTASSAAN